jgi:valyl-tRNA synthetase
VEIAKIRLAGEDGPGKKVTQAILVRVITNTLKLLHPFMPFITEELIQMLSPYSGEKAKFITQSKLPVTVGDQRYAIDPEQMNRIMDMIRAVRTVRSELNVPPGLKIKAFYFAADEASKRIISDNLSYVLHLARLESLTWLKHADKPGNSATAVAAGVTFYLPLKGIVDFEKERSRLGKALSDLDSDLAKLDERLSNPDFVDRAPQDKVRTVKSQRADVLSKQARLKETLESLA